VYGTKGHLRLERREIGLELTLDEPYESELIRYTTPGQTVNIPVPRHTVRDAANPLNQQRMFIEHVRAGKPPHVTAEQGRQDVAVVMAVGGCCEETHGKTPNFIAVNFHRLGDLLRTVDFLNGIGSDPVPGGSGYVAQMADRQR
jgi:hypothetical protein